MLLLFIAMYCRVLLILKTKINTWSNIIFRAVGPDVTQNLFCKTKMSHLGFKSNDIYMVSPPLFFPLCCAGTFKLVIEFSEEYPNKPPTVRFLSKMFHPNGECS